MTHARRHINDVAFGRKTKQLNLTSEFNHFTRIYVIYTSLTHLAYILTLFTLHNCTYYHVMLMGHAVISPLRHIDSRLLRARPTEPTVLKSPTAFEVVTQRLMRYTLFYSIERWWNKLFYSITNERTVQNQPVLGFWKYDLWSSHNITLRLFTLCLFTQWSPRTPWINGVLGLHG